LAGCGAATGVLCGFALVITAMASGGKFSFRFAGGAVALLVPAALVFIITCLLTGIPSAVVIWLSEKFHIRSVLFFCGVGAVMGGLCQILLLRVLTPWSPSVSLLFIAAGAAAGLAYWRVAGRHAGEKR
jgi:hypothetical protein